MIGIISTPLEISLLLSLLPVAVVLAYWYWRKGFKGRDTWFLLGFLCITLFYIFAPDPSVIQKLYVEGGDWTPVFIYGCISAFFLFLSVFYFRRYRG
jgi:hypothetical protein